MRVLDKILYKAKLQVGGKVIKTDKGYVENPDGILNSATIDDNKYTGIDKAKIISDKFNGQDVSTYRYKDVDYLLDYKPKGLNNIDYGISDKTYTKSVTPVSTTNTNSASTTISERSNPKFMPNDHFSTDMSKSTNTPPVLSTSTKPNGLNRGLFTTTEKANKLGIKPKPAPIIPSVIGNTTSQQSTSNTAVQPASITTTEPEKRKGLINRIFGRKDNKVTSDNPTPSSSTDATPTDVNNTSSSEPKLPASLTATSTTQTTPTLAAPENNTLPTQNQQASSLKTKQEKETAPVSEQQLVDRGTLKEEEYSYNSHLPLGENTFEGKKYKYDGKTGNIIKADGTIIPVDPRVKKRMDMVFNMPYTDGKAAISLEEQENWLNEAGDANGVYKEGDFIPEQDYGRNVNTAIQMGTTNKPTPVPEIKLPVGLETSTSPQPKSIPVIDKKTKPVHSNKEIDKALKEYNKESTKSPLKETFKKDVVVLTSSEKDLQKYPVSINKKDRTIVDANGYKTVLSEADYDWMMGKIYDVNNSSKKDRDKTNDMIAIIGYASENAGVRVNNKATKEERLASNDTKVDVTTAKRFRKNNRLMSNLEKRDTPVMTERETIDFLKRYDARFDTTNVAHNPYTASNYKEKGFSENNQEVNRIQNITDNVETYKKFVELPKAKQKRIVNYLNRKAKTSKLGYEYKSDKDAEFGVIYDALYPKKNQSGGYINKTSYRFI